MVICPPAVTDGVDILRLGGATRKFSSVGTQLFGGAEPVLLRRTFGAPAGLPQFMGKSLDLLMSESCDPMTSGLSMAIVMSYTGMLQGSAGLFMRVGMVLLPVLLTSTMGVGRTIAQFGGSSLVSVAVGCGHLESHHLVWLLPRFLGQFACSL